VNDELGAWAIVQETLTTTVETGEGAGGVDQIESWAGGLILDPGILGNDESLKKLNGHKIILHTHRGDSNNTTLYHCRIAELSVMSQNCSFVETLWASYDSTLQTLW
jgi:hypothetical protein